MSEDALGRGRDAFARRAWSVAFEELTRADEIDPLSPGDLESLATAARLIGKDGVSAELWARAHRSCLAAGETERAVRYAFWLVFALMNSGEMARAGGWLARAQRVLDEADLDCVERGYLMLPTAIGGSDADPSGSQDTFNAILELATRFEDHSLAAMARMGLGRTMIRLDRAAEGVPLLDEVMIAVTAGEAHPMVVGDLYCGVIEGCWEVFDVARVREWTAVLSDWCDAQPDLVPFKGQCLVHRAQILQLRGAWHDALAEAERACVLFSQPPGQAAAGLAFYQRAELCRLLGEFPQAEDDYRLAGEWGPSAYPGLALLRKLQGRVDVAEAAIKRSLAESTDRVTRARLLPAAAEILLAAGDVAAARAVADELATIAEAFGAPFLQACALGASGAVRVAEGDPAGALTTLRRARTAWQALGAPFEVACVRLSIGVACRLIGDEDGALIEFDAARRVFEHLVAVPFLSVVERLAGSPLPSASSGLTGRELEVLRLVAGGNSNRNIAEKLFLSEKTVARHVSNIFMKLGLSSRSAATAYAYEHRLV